MYNFLKLQRKNGVEKECIEVGRICRIIILTNLRGGMIMVKGIGKAVALSVSMFLMGGTVYAQPPIGLGSTEVSSNLELYDKSTNIEHIGHIPVPSATGIETQGNFLYAGVMDEGMRIYDISNPASPTETGRVVAPGYQNDVAVDGKTALIANDPPDAVPGFEIVDISDPAKPKIVGEYRKRRAHAITLVGDLAFPSGNRNMDIIDVSNPKNPEVIGSFQADATIHDVKVLGDRAYLALGSGHGVQIVDISDLSNPLEVSFLVDPETDYSHETIPNAAGDLVVMSDESFDTTSAGGELTFIDTSDEVNPSILSKFFINVSGYPPGTYSVHNFQIDGDKIVAAWYSAGARVIDISNPAHPQEVGYFVPQAAFTWEALTHRGYIYTGDTTRGIDILKFHPESSNSN
jgi:hypothetical protein